MSLPARLRAYAAHPDALTAGCNRIALLVASSQPTYPLYVAWLAGGSWWVACVTFLSTPCFIAVPALARRHATAGRALLVVTGVGNAMLASMALGVGSGVELFLIPTLLITLLAFRKAPRVMIALIALHAVVGLMHGHYGLAWAAIPKPGRGPLLHLNASSAAILSLIIASTLITPSSARR
ncbi:hypothetical protein [Novosphingobium terrae]|uniref:hypothetical protein n=1 Tax=Novosphingobium terrae TaxID=2726189 RepID=UPI00197E1644|nr:hypothetical protein [Novosphingobium terrae]